MKSIVQNKMITVKVTDRLENCSLVELVDISVTPNVSVTKALIDAGFAVGTQGSMVEKPSDGEEASGE